MRPAADAPAPAPDARGVAVEPTEAEIAAAWDASAGPRPMRTPDHWRATSFREFGRSFARNIARALAARATAPTTGAAADVEWLVTHFAAALRAKLHASETKYDWQNAWMRDDWADDLRRELRRHVEKGDPVDVAAYAAFAWYHGWSVAAGQGNALATIPEPRYCSAHDPDDPRPAECRCTPAAPDDAAARAWMHADQRGDVIVHMGEPPAFFATCEVRTVAGYWCPDTAPLPPDVVARAREEDTELRRLICAALYRVREWAPDHVADAALGLGPENTDAGAALGALRRAIGVTVVRREDGYLDFVDDRATPRPAPDGEVG